MIRVIVFIVAVFLFSSCVASEYDADKDQRVLLILGADWCIYCNKLKADMDTMDLSDYEVRVFNVDYNKDISARYRVSSLPTSIIILDGKEVSRKVGYIKSDYIKWLNSNKKKPSTSGSIISGRW
jgi:hypothetical protein